MEKSKYENAEEKKTVECMAKSCGFTQIYMPFVIKPLDGELSRIYEDYRGIVILAVWKKNRYALKDYMVVEWRLIKKGATVPGQNALITIENVSRYPQFLEPITSVQELQRLLEVGTAPAGNMMYISQEARERRLVGIAIGGLGFLSAWRKEYTSNFDGMTPDMFWRFGMSFCGLTSDEILMLGNQHNHKNEVSQPRIFFDKCFTIRQWLFKLWSATCPRNEPSFNNWVQGVVLTSEQKIEALELIGIKAEPRNKERQEGVEKKRVRVSDYYKLIETAQADAIHGQ